MIDKVEFPVFCEGCDPFLVAPIVEYSLGVFRFRKECKHLDFCKRAYELGIDKKETVVSPDSC